MPMNSMLAYRLKRISRNLFAAVLITLLSIYTILPLFIYGGVEFPLTDIQLSSSDVSNEESNSANDPMSKLRGLVSQQSEIIESLQIDSKYKDEQIKKLTDRVHAERMLRQDIQRGVDVAQSTSSSKPLKRIYPTLPASSIWCDGLEKRDRICKFRNLYYNPKRDAFFVVISSNSALVNIPKERSPALLDLTSLDDHSVFYFNYQEVLVDQFKDVEVDFIGKRSFLFSRFHVGNIMHTLHDDSIGLFHMLRKYSVSNTTSRQPSFANFGLDNQLVILDGHDLGGYGHVLELFSENSIMFKSDLQKNEDRILLFEDAIVGQSKLANWYQYGFGIPQGPIPNKKVSGFHVRQAADFIRWRLGLFNPADDFDVEEEMSVGVIFSRTQDRLIVNEKDLRKGLEEKFKIPVQFVRMEDQNFKEQIRILQKTKFAMGMHGSMLIMGMFMPRGSVLVEFYPYAVPGDNYTPYKTMARLPGMEITYRAWENKHEKNNIMHPEYPKWHGGLQDFPKDEQEKIMKTKTVPTHFCCTDPYWLFRIYQDTIVDFNEVSKLLTEAMEEAQGFSRTKKHDFGISPAAIDGGTVTCVPTIENGQVKQVLVKWDAPWNGVNPDEYLIWEHIAYQEFTSTVPSITLKHANYKVDTVLEIYVRTLKNGVKSSYSEKKQCTLKQG